MDKEGGNSYADVLKKLASLVPTNPATKDVYEARSRLAPHYLKAMRVTAEDLTGLHAIHISGTKGKDSSCAMLERILRQSGYRTGLLSSQHLCDVRERIRVDGAKVDKERFAHASMWLYARFHGAKISDGLPMPDYCAFLTFLALHLFQEEDVDVIILEAVTGGRSDPTNILPSPLICGMTSIGFDQTELLGSTLREIAQEMSGIFKQGAVAFTVPQYKEASEVLEQQAADVQIPLVNVGHAAKYRNFSEIPNLSVEKGVQSMNADLAVHMAHAFETATWRRPMRPALRRNHGQYKDRMHYLQNLYLLPETYLKALSEFECPGRTQKIRDVTVTPKRGNQNLTLYLDTTQTCDSTAACLSWFSNETSQLQYPVRFLLFNSPDDRDPDPLMKAVVSSMKSFDVQFRHVFFVPSLSQHFSPFHSYNHQKRQLLSWQEHLQQQNIPRISPMEQISGCHDFVETEAIKTNSLAIPANIFPSALGAIGWFRSFAREHRALDIHLLVTGSLSLVGDVLKLLGRAPK